MPRRRPLPTPGQPFRRSDTRRSRGPDGGPPPRIHDIGDLLAAVAVVLGFRPRDSLVVVGSGGPHGNAVGPTARIDLPPPRLVPGLVGQMAEHLLRTGAGSAAVIVVGGAGSHGAGVPAAAPRPDVVAAAVAALTERRILVHTTVWASAVEEGGTWRCYDECGCSGAVPDPSTTEVAAAWAAAGKVVYRDRAELESLVAPGEQASRRVPAGVPTGIDLYRKPDAGSWTDYAEEEFEHEMAGIELHEVYRERAARGVLELDDAVVGQLGDALTRSAVRDAVLMLALDHRGGDRSGGWELAPGAEALWAALSRELPDPDAAEAAALLAAASLVQGQGVLVNVALDRAEASSPGHRLTGLLRDVADRCIPPSEVRRVLLGSLRCTP